MSRKILRWFRFFITTIIVLIVILSLSVSVAYLYARNKYYNIPVLTYHHVSPPEEGNMINVSLQKFKEQMQFIKERNYKIIGPYEFLDYVSGQKQITSKNLVMLTFDDGYEDNYIHAFKLLKEYDFPAVIFVVVNKIGKEDYLTADEMKKMQESGIIFGSHTLNETYLAGLQRDELKKEIVSSKTTLERITEKPVHFFAYCTGGYTEEAQEILKDGGYLMAFTTNRGFDKGRQNNDLFAIRRIKVTDKDNWFKLWAKLTGIYNIFRDIRDPY